MRRSGYRTIQPDTKDADAAHAPACPLGTKPYGQAISNDDIHGA